MYQTKTVVDVINSTNPASYINANGPIVNSAPLNSSHPGGINIARADGSVSFVDESINLQSLQYLCGVDDGQVVNEF